MRVKLQANAKINLYLDILGKMKNGYHKIYTVMQSIDLCDFITLKIDTGNEIIILCNDDEVPTDEKNTTYKAAKIFLNEAKLNHKITIEIDKRIPLGAGLAGGSTDAAAVLLGLNEITGNLFNQEQLLKMAKKVGADVPFCLLGGTKLCEGIGDVISSLTPINNCYFLVVKPDYHNHTNSAYEEFDKMNILPNKNSKKIQNIFQTGDINSIANNLYNVFELVNKYNCDYIKTKLKNHGAINSGMTGSGSAYFGVYHNVKEARKAYKEIIMPFKYIAKPVDFGVKIKSKTSISS